MHESNPPPEDQHSPSLAERTWNFTQAITGFVADGCTMVSREQYQERLTVCDWCEQREGNFCLACGCLLSAKAAMRSEECPLGRWPQSPSVSPHHPNDS